MSEWGQDVLSADCPDCGSGITRSAWCMPFDVLPNATSENYFVLQPFVACNGGSSMANLIHKVLSLAV